MNKKVIDPFVATLGKEASYFEEMFLFREATYPHGKEVLIAKVRTEEGIDIDVFCTALPAQFWRFCITDKKGTYSLTTGSGNWESYQLLFELLKDGMIGLKRD